MSFRAFAFLPRKDALAHYTGQLTDRLRGVIFPAMSEAAKNYTAGNRRWRVTRTRAVPQKRARGRGRWRACGKAVRLRRVISG